MGWLENLIAGLGSGQGYQPPFGSEGVGGGIEDLRTQIQRMLEAQKAPLSASVAEMDSDPGALDVFKRAASVATGGKLGFDPSGEDPMHIRAQEKIAELSAQKEMARQEDEETKRMQEDAYQRQLSPESWVSGGDLAPAEKLMRIRAQARAAGREGGMGAEGINIRDAVTPEDVSASWTGGGGSFSQQADSPELQARLAERDEWASGQPERDLAFAVTPEQARRNPEYAASAADKLAGLRKAGAVEQQVANQKLLIDEYAKQGGGKIPFEMANKFDVAGFDVPWAMRGKSKDQVKENINATVIAATKDIQDVMTSPQEQQYLRWIIALAPQYQDMIDAGMDPDQLWDRFDSLVSGGAQESGAIQAYMQRTQAAQQPQE